MKNPVAWGLLGLGLLILVSKSSSLTKLFSSGASSGPAPNTTGTGAGNPAKPASGGDPFTGLIGAISGIAGALGTASGQGTGSKGAGASTGISTGLTGGGSDLTGNTSGENTGSLSAGTGSVQLGQPTLSDGYTAPVYNVDGPSSGGSPSAGSDPLGLGTLTLGGDDDT